MLGSVTRADVDAFLEKMTGEVRNHKLRDLNAFFAWCQDQGWIEALPTARVDKARRQDTEIHVFTPDQAQHFMRTAMMTCPRMVPYFSLALFAGIRPDEVKRLGVDKIGAEYVLIDGAVAKKKRRRTVPIRPNLRVWLDEYPPNGERVHYSRVDFRKVIAESGLEWKHDILRHTFATMAYSVRPDPVAISAEMGNSPTVFHEHYRALASPGDGVKFFEIYPACDLKNRNATATARKKPIK